MVYMRLLMKKKSELLVRLYMVVGAFALVVVLIFYRVVKVNVFEGDKWREKGNVHVKWRPIEADRGDIYAMDGSPLATSQPFFEIRMDLQVLKDKLFNSKVDSLAYRLSKMFPAGKTKFQWKSFLQTQRSKGNKYCLIAKDLTIAQKETVVGFPVLRNSKYKGGAIVDRYFKRRKPFRELASRTIGVDRENADKIGLEGYFDKFLKGANEKRLMKFIPPDWIPVYDPSEFEPQSGDDIYTTIDIDIQDIAHTELEAALVKYEAEAGTVVVMEVATGAIRAISNLTADGKGNYREFYNHAIGRLSEPGSTFKLATVLALMDDNYAQLDSKVDFNKGKMKFYDQTMYDSEWHGIETADLRKAFEISSNVGIANLANQHYNKAGGNTNFIRALKRFGLLDPTGIELIGEKHPYVKDPIKDKKEWFGTTIPWMAHGYELMFTPLQILNLYNTVANDGKMMKPYLVSKIKQGDKLIKDFPPRVISEKIASSNAIQGAQDLLEGVVIRGTGRKLRSEYFGFAGKTGTTRINYAKKEEEKKYNASFAGYFPAKNPKYSMMVVVYTPHGKYYGGSVAGPVFRNVVEKVHNLKLDLNKAINQGSQLVAAANLPKRRIGYKKDFEKVFEYVGIEYKNKSKSNWVAVDPFDNKMLIDKKSIIKSEVPDVRGMGARDAVYVLESLGLLVELEGEGQVRRQSIKPGANATEQKIKIYLD